jgi:hypothetical protein
MLRPVALVRTDVSEEPSASIIRVTRIAELRLTLFLVAGKCVFNCQSELTVTDDQGKCYNNLKQNVGSGTVQNGRSNITQCEAYTVSPTSRCNMTECHCSVRVPFRGNCLSKWERFVKLQKTRSADFYGYSLSILGHLTSLINL